MANRAFVSGTYFSADEAPADTFMVLADVFYSDGTITGADDKITEAVPIDASASDVAVVLVGAAVVQAPVGFEVTAADVVLLALTSG